MRVLIIIALSITFGPAYAATTCAARETIVAQLNEKYGETQRAIGLTSDNLMMEVYASEANGTWTITVTDPSGRTCFLSAGTAYEQQISMPAPAGIPG